KLPSRRAKPDRRRALELLASCRDGCTEAIMLAHGFTIEQMVELVRAGLVTATPEAFQAASINGTRTGLGSRQGAHPQQKDPWHSLDPAPHWRKDQKTLGHSFPTSRADIPP